MSNTIVIKPSIRRADLDSYEDIINNGEARSFAASVIKVRRLKYIVVTDGANRAVIGDITDVAEAIRTNPKGMGRINITFDNVRELQNLFEDVHLLIAWNNRRNIRYIYFEPG